MAGAFRLDVKSSIDAFVRGLDARQQREVPFVSAYALTKTAQEIKAAEVELMAQVFDRPTRFTLNALYVRPATKRDLRAYVEFKEGFGSIPAWRYLGPQVEGGARAKKSHERALERAGLLRSDEFVVPGKGAKLDAYGNMKGPEITRILAQLGAAEHGAGYQANMTARSKKRNVRKAGGRYFVLRDRGAPNGVYFRKTGSRELTPIMIFVRAPHYAKRFPFYDKAREVFDLRFAANFRDGWQRYVASKSALAA